MRVNIKQIVSEFAHEKIIKRKAMFLPLVCVSSFMLVGYAAMDRVAPTILTNEIDLAYQNNFDLGMVAVEDNRDEPGSIVMEMEKTNLNINQLGTYTVTLTATDSFNNVATKDIRVNVVDLVAPEFAPAQNVEGYAIPVPASGSDDISHYIVANDNVDGDLTPFIEMSQQLDTKQLGVQAIELKVSDSSGNSAVKTFEFNISDTQAPVINLTKGSNVTLDYNQSFNINNYFEVKDNYDSVVDVKFDKSVSVTKYQEAQTVEIVATDSSQNQTKATITFTVEDKTAPKIYLSKSSISVQTGTSVNPKSYLSSAHDNRDGVITGDVSYSSISTSSAGTRYVTYKVTDEAGNTGTARLKVYVFAPVTYSSATGNSIVNTAYTKIGVPYVYGATGPYSFDCSGFTQWVYRQNGISIPRTSTDQRYGNCQVLSISNARAGDILWRYGHVAIYVGGNSYIHAPHTGAYVRVDTGIYSFTYALRYG